jgi:hypothetical protein
LIEKLHNHKRSDSILLPLEYMEDGDGAGGGIIMIYYLPEV